MQLDGFDFDQERFYLRKYQRFVVFFSNWDFYREEMELIETLYYNYSMAMVLPQINQVIYIEDQKIEHNVDR